MEEEEKQSVNEYVYNQLLLFQNEMSTVSNLTRKPSISSSLKDAFKNKKRDSSRKKDSKKKKKNQKYNLANLIDISSNEDLQSVSLRPKSSLNYFFKFIFIRQKEKE